MLFSAWRSNNATSSSSRSQRSHAHDQLSVQTAVEERTVHSEASSVTAVPPSPPPLAVPHTASRAQHDALTDFFGGRGQRLRAERHHTRGDARRESRVPPPYSPDWDGEKLPGYSQAVSSPEPDTVAKQLFKYGFCKSLSRGDVSPSALTSNRSRSVPGVLGDRNVPAVRPTAGVS